LSLKQTVIGPAPAAPSGGAAAGAPAGGAAGGAQVYATRCASCHQPTGTGVPGAFPPLAGDPVVNGPAAAHLDVVLNGLHGKTINGVAYAGVMPPWGAAMSDADIASVVSYERTSWGNHGSAVSASDVAAARHHAPAGP
jgi:nitrite reductase (NO-forming)